MQKNLGVPPTISKDQYTVQCSEIMAQTPFYKVKYQDDVNSIILTEFNSFEWHLLLIVVILRIIFKSPKSWMFG